jgi:hypothetical protein
VGSPARLEGGLGPLLDRLTSRRAQLRDLERGVTEREAVLKGVQGKIQDKQQILR